MTTSDTQTPLDDRREIDELIPPEIEDGPLTWLDHAGLHRELDAAADLVEARLRECGETHARERIKAAIAEWALRDLLSQLGGVVGLLAGGAEHFFSVLAPAAAPACDGAPPPPPAPTHDAATGIF